jgi:hypothetical protein
MTNPIKSLCVLLILASYGCYSPAGEGAGNIPAELIPPPSSSVAGAPDADYAALAKSGLTAADSRRVVDVPLAPCGPAHCPAPTLDLQLSGQYGCFAGICTVRCSDDYVHLPAWCASVGGECSGDSSGVLLCQ